MSQISQSIQYSAVESTQVVTDDTQMVPNASYIANKAGLLTLTLPDEAYIGDSIEVTGINSANGWKIAQNANQTIHIVDTSTTTGTSGSLASTSIYDSVRLLCTVEGSSTEWNVVSIMGNLTIT